MSVTSWRRATRALRCFCWLYVASIAVALIADVVIAITMPYGGRIGAGCNFTDAMVVGVKCQGFAGADAIALFLNWPLFLVYAPIFTFSSLWFLIPTVLLWLPPAYLLVSFLRRRHANRSESGDIQELSAEILRHISEHPLAADDLNGIRRYWLKGHTGPVETLRVVLDRLAEQRHLARRTLPDGSTIYSRAD